MSTNNQNQTNYNMKLIESMGCIACGSSNIMIRYSHRYNGFRGRCSECGSEWPDS